MRSQFKGWSSSEQIISEQQLGRGREDVGKECEQNRETTFVIKIETGCEKED